MAQCTNNLKQLGIGVLSYHATNRQFPPAMTMPMTESPLVTSKFGPNWVILILPNIGENALYNSFYLTVSGGTTFTTFNPNPINANANSPTTVFVPISDPRNALPRSTPLSLMLCPTDAAFNQRGYVPGQSRNGGYNAQYNDSPPLSNGSPPPPWARGNYGANVSIGYPDDFMYGAAGNGVQSYDWTNPLMRGVMGCNTSLSLDQVHDGASCTVLLGELRAGVTPVDHRGIWAMGNAGGSALWGHGATDDSGPNNQSIEADDLCECPDLSIDPGITSLMARYHMGGCCCYDTSDTPPNWEWNSNGNHQQTTRSSHVHGVFVCMCDGSVHFISDFIDHAGVGWTSSANELHVWERLNASSDGLPIDASQWQ